MRHQIKGKKLNRNINQRKALFKNLARELILKERIITTEAKARAVRPMIEKLLTKAKKGGLHQRRKVLAVLPKDAVQKLFVEANSRFRDQKSGYTKTIKLGKRRGDNAPMVILEWSRTLKVAKEKKEEPKKANSGKNH